MPFSEFEATLVVCSTYPEGVADGVARLTTIGEYELRIRPSMSMSDAYLDLPGEPLASVGMGLRIRRAGSRSLITLKGPARQRDGGVIREELERPWSGEALDAVRDRLARDGVAVPQSSGCGHGDPLDVLTGLGFSVVQRRETFRRPRDVRHKRQASPVLAELVVDAVGYRVGGKLVKHHEIEIEVKAEDGEAAMRGITRALRAEWGAELRVWRFGKLATGRAVEALLAESQLDSVIDEEGRLTPAAYALLEHRLGGGR